MNQFPFIVQLNEGFFSEIFKFYIPKKVPNIAIFACRTRLWGLQREFIFLDSPIPIFWFVLKKVYSSMVGEI